MNSTLIRERLNRDTSPFVLRLSNGTRVLVAHPDFAAVSRSKVAVIDAKTEGVTRVAPSDVVAIEELSKRNESDGTIKRVRNRLLQSPFVPFIMHLTDGRKILVEHPNFVAVGGSVVVVTDLDDNIQRIDSLHIISLDDAPQKKWNSKHSR